MVEAKIDPEKKLLFLLMFLILVGSIYGTYAYFSSKSQGEEQTIVTGKIDLSFVDNNPILNEQNIVPILESDVLTRATKKSFSIKNIGNINATMKISLTSIQITEELKSSEFKWTLYENNVKVAEDSFDKLGANTSLDLKSDILIDVNETKKYDLYIWIQETNTPQNELQNGKLTSIISATLTQ